MSSIEDRLALLRKKKQEIEERKKREAESGAAAMPAPLCQVDASSTSSISGAAAVVVSVNSSGFTGGAATATDAAPPPPPPPPPLLASLPPTKLPVIVQKQQSTAAAAPTKLAVVRSLHPKYREGPAPRYGCTDLLGDLMGTLPHRGKRNRDNSGAEGATGCPSKSTTTPPVASELNSPWSFLKPAQGDVGKVDLGAGFTAEVIKNTTTTTTEASHPTVARSCNKALAPRLTGLARYRKDKPISEGVYGQVYQGLDLQSNTIRALKIIKASWFEQSQIGFPPYLMREFDILLRLDHPNIVRAHELVMGTEPDQRRSCEVTTTTTSSLVGTATQGALNPQSTAQIPVPPAAAVPEGGPATTATHPSSSTSPPSSANSRVVLLVMDHCIVDLKNFLSDPQSHPGCLKTGVSRLAQLKAVSEDRHIPQLLTNVFHRKISRVKCIMQQLLSGLDFLHEHSIVHRDLKSSNVLIDAQGGVKVCDFGLARVYQDGDMLSPNVVTLMYRAPELHFGIRDYNAGVDIWAAGCIFFECLRGRPLFLGNDVTSHFKSLCTVLGEPTDADFTGIAAMPEALKLLHSLPFQVDRRKNQIRTSVEYLGEGFSELLCDAGYDFLTKMIAWNPMNRWSAAQLLKHPYLTGSTNHAAAAVSGPSTGFVTPCTPAEILIPLLDRRYAEQDGLGAPQQVQGQDSVVAGSGSNEKAHQPVSSMVPNEAPLMCTPSAKGCRENDDDLLGHESRTPGQQNDDVGNAAAEMMAAVGNLQDDEEGGHGGGDAVPLPTPSAQDEDSDGASSSMGTPIMVI